MKLINFAIHKNVAPPISETPFQPKTALNDTIVTVSIQFEDEAKALSFASDIMKTIEHYRE